MNCLNPDRDFLIKHIRFDKRIARAEGHYLYAEDGSAYLDFIAQFGAVPFGYNPDFLWDAILRVRDARGPTLTQPLPCQGAEALAAELVRLSPGHMRYATFTNSGAESVEAAIKLGRASTGRAWILGTHTGFHGKTIGAASAGGRAIYREPFLADTRAFDHVPYGDLEALEARLRIRDVALFLVEAVQGEGGMLTPPPGYLREAARLCRSYGTLLALDEVQTGLGRTGHLFAAEEEGIEPDLLLLAKALGGGMVSIGAMLCTERAWVPDFGLYHSSTFANNHLSCSIGLAVLERLLADDRAVIRSVAEKGAYLQKQLEALVALHPGVFEDTTGKGLMQAVRLAPWPAEDGYFLATVSDVGYAVPLVCGYLLAEHGVLTLPTISHQSALRIEPPLTIEYAEIDRLLAGLHAAAELIGEQDWARLLSYITGKPAAHVQPRRETWHEDARPSWVAPDPEREQRLGSFAFLMHPTEFADILRCLPPDLLERYDDDQRLALKRWLASWCARVTDVGLAYHLPALRSRAGGYVEGWLVASYLQPQQMLRLRERERHKLLNKYLDVARGLGADVIGLGAFTSVVSRGGKDIEKPGLVLTTGNSVTALAAAESLVQVAASRGVDLQHVRTGVVGATGSVGRLVCRKLAQVCGRLTLFGNRNNPHATRNLRVLGGELYRDALLRARAAPPVGLGRAMAFAAPDVMTTDTSRIEAASDDELAALFAWVQGRVAEAGRSEPPVQVTVELERHLPEMTTVVSATSAGHRFIHPQLLAPHAIGCDVSRPPDVTASVVGQRPDVFVYEGGMMELPESVQFGRDNVSGFPRGVSLGCLSETMVLAMAGGRRSYSIGDRIPLAEAEEVYALARHHGFRVALRADEPRVAVGSVAGVADGSE